MTPLWAPPLPLPLGEFSKNSSIFFIYQQQKKIYKIVHTKNIWTRIGKRNSSFLSNCFQIAPNCLYFLQIVLPYVMIEAPSTPRKKLKYTNLVNHENKNTVINSL